MGACRAWRDGASSNGCQDIWRRLPRKCRKKLLIQLRRRLAVRMRRGPSTRSATGRWTSVNARCARGRARRNPAPPSAHRCSKTGLLAMPANCRLSLTVSTVVFAGHDDRRWRVGQTAAVQPEGISEMRPGVSLAFGPEDKATPTEPGGTAGALPLRFLPAAGRKRGDG